MKQLSMFDDAFPYWRLTKDFKYVHEFCGYSFDFFGYGYRIKPVCPKCGTAMLTFYSEGGR